MPSPEDRSIDDNNTPRTSKRKIPRWSAASYPSVILTATLAGWRWGLTVLARTPIGDDLAASTLPWVDAKAIENISLQESLAFSSLQGLMASSADHHGTMLSHWLFCSYSAQV